MSVKRQATTDINHENWDQEDPSADEEMGTFKPAPKEVLQTRVMRTAKRRTHHSIGDGAKKSVFSGFGGFNKPQPSSFDFLANLTNGKNITDSSSFNKTEATASSNLFSVNPQPNSFNTINSGGGIFGTPVSSESVTKLSFGTSTTPSSSLFGSLTSPTTLFTPSKSGSPANDNPFKIQPVPETSKPDLLAFKNTNTNISPPTPQTSSKVFGTTTTTTSQNSSIFKIANTVSPLPSLSQTSSVFASPLTTTSISSTLFGSPATTSPIPSKTIELPSVAFNNKSLFTMSAVTTSPTVQPVLNSIGKSHGITTKMNINTNEIKNKENPAEISNYHLKLTALNKAVSEWIRTNIEKTPICILSPIFNDYNKYVKEIQDEYFGSYKGNELQNDSQQNAVPEKQTSDFSLKTNDNTNNKNSVFNLGSQAESSTKNATTVFSDMASRNSFPPNNNLIEMEKPFNFAFGVKTTGTSSSTTSSAGLSFGTSTSTATTSSPFSFGSNTAPSNGTTPFAFGTGKPFSFNSNIQKPVEKSNEDEEKEDEEPPKVEFTPVVEENSVYDKRCKVFFKKDGNFIDKGIGTLYIKKIEDTGKHQLLIRANTNLGNVLVNLLLSSSIPTQLMGKNNVMMVCIPTPDAKPPPQTILIRVKTSEEANELLETIKKYQA